MSMAGYANYTAGSRGRRIKRLIIGIVCGVLVVLAAIYVIGLLVGVNDEQGREISATVSDNVALRQQVSEKDDEIERLNNEIKSLKAQLENRQTPPPAETPVPTATPESAYRYSNGENEYLSPRSGDMQ